MNLQRKPLLLFPYARINSCSFSFRKAALRLKSPQLCYTARDALLACTPKVFLFENSAVAMTPRSFACSRILFFSARVSSLSACNSQGPLGTCTISV